MTILDHTSCFISVNLLLISILYRTLNVTLSLGLQSAVRTVIYRFSAGAFAEFKVTWPKVLLLVVCILFCTFLTTWVMDRARRREEVDQAYELQARAAMIGAARYTAIGLGLATIGHYSWPLFRSAAYSFFITRTELRKHIQTGDKRYRLKRSLCQLVRWCLPYDSDYPHRS